MPVASFDTIPGGWQGTADTVSRMHELIQQGKTDLTLQKIADKIVASGGARDRDYNSQASSIYDFVKSYVRFQRDPFGVEMVQEPVVTLGRKAGDCDDHTILNCALLGAIGFPYAIKTIKADLTRPDEFSHVYAIVYINSRGWIGFDTSVGPAYYSWQPPGKYDFKVWPPRVD